MNLDIKLHKEDLPDQLVLSDNIAVDCEFMGLNVERDNLCLVQISTGKNDAHIVQLNRETYIAPNLLKILSDKNINKIFHYARADLLFIKKYLKIDVENVNCTKIMSKLARSYSDKHGLKDLVKEFIGTEISKNLQSSDFGGNLSEKQLQYCAKDVIYLHKIYESLKKILVRENRYNLYKDTIKFIKTRVNLDINSFNSDIWSH
ncbi:3'-5' exonuclease [Pelagibacteraceae bacterium GOM-A2]|nr:3'-5' exonuclease [Pelagibacteraceae bacterium GOM-A2]